MWASHRVFLVSLEMIMGVADDKWRSATFDSTGSHIIVAGDRGFRVASSLGHAIIDERPELGPCDQISQCGASNLFVISKSEPSYRCLLFDDSRRRVIGELGPFESRPVGLRWIDDAGIIVVQLEAGEVLAYNVMDELRLVRRGPCAEPATAGTLAAVNLGGVARVAHAGKERGSVVVAEIPRTACPEGAAPMPVTTAIGQNDKHQAAIRAHNRDIASVALSHDGLRVATASSKGTVIRIFHVAVGSSPLSSLSLDIELRRSSSRTARMHALAFSFDSPPSLLACASDAGTLHVFSLTGRSSVTQRRSKWRYVLPGKDRCALSFHSRSPVPLLTVASHSGDWQIALVLEDDGTTRDLAATTEAGGT